MDEDTNPMLAGKRPPAAGASSYLSPRGNPASSATLEGSAAAAVPPSTGARRTRLCHVETQLEPAVLSVRVPRDSPRATCWPQAPPSGSRFGSQTARERPSMGSPEQRCVTPSWDDTRPLLPHISSTARGSSVLEQSMMIPTKHSRPCRRHTKRNGAALLSSPRQQVTQSEGARATGGPAGSRSRSRSPHRRGGAAKAAAELSSEVDAGAHSHLSGRYVLGRHYEQQLQPASRLFLSGLERWPADGMYCAMACICVRVCAPRSLITTGHPLPARPASLSCRSSALRWARCAGGRACVHRLSA